MIDNLAISPQLDGKPLKVEGLTLYLCSQTQYPQVSGANASIQVPGP